MEGVSISLSPKSEQTNHIVSGVAKCEEKAGKGGKCVLGVGVLYKTGPRRDTCFPTEKDKALSGILAKCVQCWMPSQPEQGTEEAALDE